MSLEGALDRENVLRVERLALVAWPGLETVRMGGWRARFASGVTRRANSVWPNEIDTPVRVEDMLVEVESFYRERQLPPRFQICPAALPSSLDQLLAELGYRAVARTAVQTTTMANLRGTLGESVQSGVILTSQSAPEWWECFAEADEVSEASVAVRKQICEAIGASLAYAMAVRDGQVIAVGSAVAMEGWIGFFNIATLHSHRRSGAAQSVMAALCQWGESLGATNAYLQVMVDNGAALKLYEALGFVTGYFYHYRELAI